MTTSTRMPRAPRAPRALVLRTAGTNCDHETVQALELAGASVVRCHVRALIAQPQRLDEVEIVVIAGGFSYGDDVAAGRIFGLDLRAHLAGPFAAFVERGGFVLGVCNGFQVLVDTGLLEPGRSRAEREIALSGNAPGRYQCRWVLLEAHASACSWLEPGTRLPCPVAHAEGRVVLAGPSTRERLARNGQIALTYVDPGLGAERGAPRDATDRLPYPLNPNGSAADIAGLCDPTGRVLGLMPHPERNLHPWQHPTWSRRGPRDAGEGLAFYRAMVDAARNGYAAPAPRARP